MCVHLQHFVHFCCLPLGSRQNKHKFHLKTAPLQVLFTQERGHRNCDREVLATNGKEHSAAPAALGPGATSPAAGGKDGGKEGRVSAWHSRPRRTRRGHFRKATLQPGAHPPSAEPPVHPHVHPTGLEKPRGQQGEGASGAPSNRPDDLGVTDHSSEGCVDGNASVVVTDPGTTQNDQPDQRP